MALRALLVTDVCMLLKRMPETRDIPVIIYSGLISEDLRIIGQACGAVAYLLKSPDPTSLLAEIRRRLDGALETPDLATRT